MKKIPGYDDYSIDEYGNVWSHKFGRDKKLKQTEGKGGHLHINLSTNGCLKVYPVHRLVYISFVGDIPIGKEIDHIDRNPKNNHISNLRAVTRSENKWNRSKTKGYSWHKVTKKFRAQIVLNYKPIHLGLFDTAQEAQAAYLAAKEKLHIIQPDIAALAIQTNAGPDILNPPAPDGLQP